MFGLGYQELLLKKGVAADPDEDRKSSPPAPSATATVPRTCSSCKAPLDVTWSHCPRCGMAVA